MTKIEYTGYGIVDCIADIARGLVEESLVLEINSGTTAQSASDWQRLFASYQKYNWSDTPGAEEIAHRLLKDGKIKQPLLDGEKYEKPKGGEHWTIKRRIVSSNEKAQPN